MLFHPQMVEKLPVVTNRKSHPLLLNRGDRQAPEMLDLGRVPSGALGASRRCNTARGAQSDGRLGTKAGIIWDLRPLKAARIGKQ